MRVAWLDLLERLPVAGSVPVGQELVPMQLRPFTHVAQRTRRHMVPPRIRPSRSIAARCSAYSAWVESQWPSASRNRAFQGQRSDKPPARCPGQSRQRASADPAVCALSRGGAAGYTWRELASLIGGSSQLDPNPNVPLPRMTRASATFQSFGNRQPPMLGIPVQPVNLSTLTSTRFPWGSPRQRSQ